MKKLIFFILFGLSMFALNAQTVKVVVKPNTHCTHHHNHYVSNVYYYDYYYDCYYYYHPQHHYKVYVSYIPHNVKIYRVVKPRYNSHPHKPRATRKEPIPRRVLPRR